MEELNLEESKYKVRESVYARIWFYKGAEKYILLVLNKAGKIVINGQFKQRDTGWSAPGGGIKDGDPDVISAGLREIREETGEIIARLIANKVNLIPYNGEPEKIVYLLEAKLNASDLKPEDCDKNGFPKVDCEHDPAETVMDSRWVSERDFIPTEYDSDHPESKNSNRIEFKSSNGMSYRIYKGALKRIEFDPDTAV